jgi:hypothetical protein
MTLGRGAAIQCGLSRRLPRFVAHPVRIAAAGILQQVVAA